MIGLGRVIYHIKAFSVVIRTPSKRKGLQIFPGVEKKRSEIFDFSSKFERVSRVTLAQLCLF